MPTRKRRRRIKPPNDTCWYCGSKKKRASPIKTEVCADCNETEYCLADLHWELIKEGCKEAVKMAKTNKWTNRLEVTEYAGKYVEYIIMDGEPCCVPRCVAGAISNWLSDELYPKEM